MEKHTLDKFFDKNVVKNTSSTEILFNKKVASILNLLILYILIPEIKVVYK